ncbi:MAG: dephospho-CoA kinase [Deltaproteobacteria bacterium]|nr:dephospho-CoA kinase [Deltaproteobacteria bacterium]
MSHSTPVEPTFTVHEGLEGKRLDTALMAMSGRVDTSRSKIQTWIKDGLATVDGLPCLKPGYRLKAGQRVFIEAPPSPQGRTLEPDPTPLGILWGDNDLAVIDKPAGLCTHPAPGIDEPTLAHRLAFAFPALAKPGDQRPGIVHRLDKDTSGVLVVAKSQAARLALARQFAARSVEKEYLAVVHGRPGPDRGRIELPLGRHPEIKTKMAVVPKGGRPALTTWEHVWSPPGNGHALLRVRIFTGRTHQIRVHLAHIGHPILGDRVYGPKSSVIPGNHPLLGKLVVRQLLHAWHVRLDHPLDGSPIDVRLPPPQDFMRVLLLLQRKPMVVALTGLPGSGKSVLATALAAKGERVWSADDHVRDLYRQDGDGWEMLRRSYGSRFLEEHDGQVDRQKLFQAMIEEPGLRREVEGLIHPLVAHGLETYLASRSKDRVIFAEIPLLAESRHLDKNRFDLILGVFRPENERLAALKSRGWSPEVIAAMESWHLSAKTKYQSCGLIVDNSGHLERLEHAADLVSAILVRLRARISRRLKTRLDSFFATGQFS